MPVLANQRHELFAQELAKGKTADEAYQLAGYNENRHNASRLKTNETISARVAEILSSVAERAEITVHDIIDQLDEDRTFARKCVAASAAIQATMGKAKVLGFLVDRTEHTGKDGGPMQVEEVSDEDAVKRMLFLMARARQDRGESIN